VSAPLCIAIGDLAIAISGLRPRPAARGAGAPALRPVSLECGPAGRDAARASRSKDARTRRTPSPKCSETGEGSRCATVRSTRSSTSKRAAARRHSPPSVHVVDSLLRIAVSHLALERSAILVHACGVRARSAILGATAPKQGTGALVFFGPSGSGKTTIARSVAADDVMCDEMILLSVDDRRRRARVGTAVSRRPRDVRSPRGAAHRALFAAPCNENERQEGRAERERQRQRS